MMKEKEVRKLYVIIILNNLELNRPNNGEGGVIPKKYYKIQFINDHNKKSIILFLLITAIGGTLMFGLSGCFGKRYKVDYCGQKSSFEGARDSYRPGDKVELKFKYIATDTDYYFYVDGERVNPDYSDRDGYVIRFSMPAHDVTVKWSSKNSMIADPPFEEKMLIDDYTAVVGTDGYVLGGNPMIADAVRASARRRGGDRRNISCAL